MPADDPFNLDRFTKAQERVYPGVLEELRRGRKQGHWIWFIFPQLKGLGRSSTSEFYGISGLEEAKAYLEHPVLGQRLLECTRLVNQIEDRSAEQIFGFPDWLKFRSCMTLFAAANPENPEFNTALGRYFGGNADPKTLELI